MRERERYDELSLLHVSGEIGNFLAEIREVGERGVKEGEPRGDGERVLLEGFAEGLAVDEDEDLAALGVEQRRLCGGGEVCGDALECGGCSGGEGVRRLDRAEELMDEEDLESVREGREPARVLERETVLVGGDAELGERALDGFYCRRRRRWMRRLWRRHFTARVAC